MAWMKRAAVAAALALMTTGCAMYRLEELRRTAPSGSPFQSELSKLYMDFAGQEEKEYDWWDSAYFAGKGLELAYGRDVAPEDPADWNLPEEVSAEIQKARIELMELLTPELMRARPAQAAAAQFYFDCWVEQQDEGWQADDIAFCRDKLMDSLGDLRGMTPAPEPEAKPKPKPARKAGAKPEAKAEAPKKSPPPERSSSETISYAVFFETSTLELSEPGKGVIEEVIRSAKEVADSEIVLHVAGGKSDADKALLGERAQKIRKLLVEGGVPESAVKAAGSESGGKTPARRIELFLNE